MTIRPITILSSPSLQNGFTLIEVLVALVIAAVALTAAVRALSFSTDQTQALHDRQLAMLSAENLLTELRLSGAWPNPGTQTIPCPQGYLQLLCQQKIESTEDRNFRQASISVSLDKGAPLARLTGIIPRRNS